jgi:hypothetical protein
MAAEFIIADSLIYSAFAVAAVVGTALAYFVISLIGGS